MQRPLAGVISWQQHRKEAEAAWEKANKKNPPLKSHPAAANPEATEPRT